MEMKQLYTSWMLIPVFLSFFTNDPVPRKIVQTDSLTALQAQLFVSPSVVGAAVTAQTPVGGSLNVSVSTTQLNLPNGPLVDATVNTNTVKLFVDATDVEVTTTSVNATGGGDAITLTATGLNFNTTYRLEISSGVEDAGGESMIPFTYTFTTQQDTGGGSGDVEFEQVQVASGDQYTSLRIGPDGKLYGLVNNGEIHRWTINGDGTLSNQEIIDALQNAEGGNRLAIGFDFDPSATAGNLIAWVSHTTFGFGGMADWQGKITRMSGPDLGTVQDYLINLPRSAKDHVTNGIDFGPDGALYFLQGSNSAMGAADGTWSFRPERLLAAACLRLDPGAVTNPPLDVHTEDNDPYDPFAPGAPLTIFGSGIRNAYDLVWHSNGQLYVPTNGSAAGGNTPELVAGDLPLPTGTRVDEDINGQYTGPTVPGINGVSQTQNDLLFRVVENGYYGHPNPTRGEYVLNGGNPTSGSDPVQVNQYPVGTQPDRNWRGVAYNFANNKSPNGVIEYQSNTFNGALQGKLLVVRYSGGDDIIVLTPGGANQDIIDDETGIDGFTGFNNPLDLTENLTNGHIYVSEYGGSDITLLRPVGSTGGAPDIALDVPAKFDFNESELLFSAPTGQTDTRTFTIQNVGGADLTLNSISSSGGDAGVFSASVGGSTFPLTLIPTESVVVTVTFDPGTVNSTTNYQSTLQISSDDPDESGLSIPLYALGTQGIEGNNEAPMADILETLGIAVDVGWTTLGNTTSPTLQGEEIAESVFKKAGSGDVILLPVARYAPDWVLPFGWYTNDGSLTLNEVGQLSGASNPPEHQTICPEIISGGMTFDPGAGTEFGLYTTSPSHTAYTEDDVNAAEHPDKVAHAVRIYPLKDRNGNLVPDGFLLGFEEASNGDYNDYVFVMLNAQLASAPDDPVAVERLNVNGPQLTTVAGDVFEADVESYVSGENTADTKSFDVLGTDDDDLYLTYRFGQNFSYNIPVSGTGPFTVRLHFCEVFFGAPGGGTGGNGQRVFDVTVEGNLELDDLDLFAENNAAATAVVKEIAGVTVNDGVMNIDFAASTNNGIISAIEILSDDPGPGNTPPTVANAIPDQAATAGTAFSYQFPENTFDDADQGDVLTYSATEQGQPSLPAWLNFDPNTRTFSGTPPAAGTVQIAVTATDGDDASVTDVFSIAIGGAPAGNVLYRETFWNTDAVNDISITERDWIFYQSGGAQSGSQEAASKGLGAPAGLQNVNAGDLDPSTTLDRGFAANFSNQNTYFGFTNEFSIDQSAFDIEQISWYQGNNNANAELRVALQIGGQWYVSNQVFTNPAVGSGDDFVNEAVPKVFTFSTDASEWLDLIFTPGSELTLGNSLANPLPAGTITGFGLYGQAPSGFTMRFDTYQIEGASTGGGGNNPPVVANPIPDQNAAEGQPFSYQFPENTFSDPDQNDVLTYSATEQGQTGLPAWLNFDANTRTFSGTPPSAGQPVIEVTATDGSNAFITDAFTINIQPANQADCSPVSPELCATIPVDISAGYCLEWNGDEGGLPDGAGTGAGFTMVDAPSAPLTTPSNPDVPGYEPDNLLVDNGLLTITATKGIFFEVAGNNGNSQVNGLGVGFDADGIGQPYEITTKLVNLPAPGSTNFQQAGLWFGLDEANYVKLVAITTSANAYSVQLSYEENDDAPNANMLDAPDNVINAGEDVVLKMELDPSTNTVAGFYSLDDGATFQQVGNGSLTLAPAMFTGVNLPDNSAQVSFAGVHATIRNANASNSLDYAFDRFCINEQTGGNTSQLAITAALQGRSDFSGAYEVNLYQPGNATPAYTFAPTADGNGEMIVSGIAPGTYEVAVKHPQFLQVVETVTLAAGANTLNAGTLDAGDANDDNQISALDFSILATTFNLGSGDAGYDGRADFDGNNQVGAIDFSLLATNFNTSGEMPSGQ